MLVPVLLFILGLLLLIKGGDWFVDGAAGTARRFHIPEIIIGATVVSIGTTLPEVMVSASAAVQGLGSMAYGNAIGSIICNTALVSAVTMAIRPARIDRKSLYLPMAFFFSAALLYVLVAVLAGSFSRLVGILLLGMFAAYMILSVVLQKKHPESALAEAGEDDEEEEGEPAPLWKDVLLLVVGAAMIAVGARLLVDNGTLIAAALGVPETVIALTFVALGTSLPELVTAITALAKGHGALSVGNIIGANMFNLVLVCGISISIAPFAVPAEKTLAGMNASLIVDMPVMLLVMLIMSVPALLKGKLYKWQGYLLLAIYAAYCVFQFAA